MYSNFYVSSEPRFVNRLQELDTLLRYSQNGYYPVLFLYGPEGCGKTRLLKELYAKLRTREDFLAIYVDAQSTGEPDKAVLAPPEILQSISDIVKEIAGPIGKAAALAILHVNRIFKRLSFKNKHVVVIVDDVVRSLGYDIIEIYTKNLLKLLEELLNLGAESVFVLATISEGVSRSLLARHNYVILTQMWNLDKESFYELLDELGAPSNEREEIWKNLGGNPRLAIMLKTYRWDLTKLENDLYRSIKVLIEPIITKFKKELREIVEDVDKVLEYEYLRNYLLERNIITPIDRPCLGYTPSVDPELGIGRHYAWQIPLYRKLVQRYLEEL